MKILLVTFLMSLALSGQTKEPIKKIIQSNKSKDEKIKRIDSLLAVLKKQQNDSLSYFYHDYSYWLYDVKELENSIYYDERALALENSKKKKDSSFMQRCALALGFYYSKNKELNKSITSYKRVVQLNNENENAKKAYGKIGYSLSNLQDYEEALNYLELAVALQKNTPKDLKYGIVDYSNLSFVCLKLQTHKSFIKGIKYGKLADSLAALFNVHYSRNYFIKLNLAQLHHQNISFHFEASLGYYNEALKIVEQAKDTVRIRDIFYGKGALYSKKDNARSLHNFELALNLTKEVDSLGLYLNNIGKGLTYAYGENYEKSIESTLLGLNHLTGVNFKEPQKIKESYLIDFKDKQHLLYTLPLLAEIHLKYYEKTLEKTLLDKSIAYFKMADIIISLLKLNTNEFQSKLFWQKISADLYGKAIRACYLNNQKKDAFYFMEKNKALILMEDLTAQKFKRSLTLPKGFIEEEKDFLTKLTILEYELKNNTRSKSESALVAKKIIDTKLGLSGLKDNLELDTKGFLPEPSIIDLESVQSNLSTDEVIIEYHISQDDGLGVYSNKERGYALYIGNKECELFEIENLSLLKKNIRLLIEDIKNPFTTILDIKEFNTLSHKTYLDLFPSEKIRQQIKNKKLNIITDDYLSSLPFEVLTTSSNELNYLIRDTEISYLYSYSFLKNLENPEVVKHQFLGFAPETFNDSNLTPLAHSKEELKSLNKNYVGKIFSEEAANKKTFLKELPNYSIVHLATHANAQDSISPWIAFKDQKIFLEELYLTQNQASLVVLSGCNTTLGKQEAGEGIMSLARGFFYSGAKSVISTLWSIDDKSTAEILNNFYGNLSKGQTKSLSLKNAKLNYIDTHSLAEASPYYWASPILIGENTSLPGNSSTLWKYVLGILLILTLAYLYYRLKRKVKP